MTGKRCLAVSLFCIGILVSKLVLANDYTVMSTPVWVKPVAMPGTDPVNQHNHSNGVAYLLVDYQTRVQRGQQTRYHHFISQALNPSGVSEVSQIAIDFDPEYESVKLHTILVHRNGQTFDMRARSTISVLQREEELEYQIYDGSKTINIFIEDIRAGDRVEYSYSLDGANPVYAGHFFDYNQLQWSVPVDRVHHRLLWPASRPLHIRNHATTLAPEKTTQGKVTEYVWQLHQTTAIVTDPDTPSWYDPYPAVYLSDMASWQDVAKWALPLYQPVSGTPRLNAVMDDIVASTSSPEERVSAALQFVQNEVRYLGIEMGARSHKPNLPDEVLKQRFGDCKDKSRLLVSLLQKMGIEATTALVNTNRGISLKEQLPTPTVFNHVIVLARVGEKNYWLDPTRTYQAGDLTTLYQPDYDYALVVSPNSNDLTAMSGDIPGPHSKGVEETFDIRNVIDTPAHYKIVNHFERYFADAMRQTLSETSHDEVQQTYLNYLARNYPNIAVANNLQIDDEAATNRLSVIEEYKIQDIWDRSEDERYLLVDFSPSLIVDNLKEVEAPIRKMPFSIAHPVRYRHLTRILLPEDSSFENEVNEVVDDAFRFVRKVTFANDVLEIEYLYESLTGHINPEGIAAYVENINKVLNLAYFQIQMPNPAIDLGNFQYKANDINWMLVGITLAAFFVFIVLIAKYIYLYDPPYDASVVSDAKLEGIGGWLVLPAIGVVISPLMILVTSKELWFAYSSVQWSIVGDQFNGSALKIIIGAETIGNVGLLVMSVFLIVMFFQKRHTLPRFFILFMVISFALVGADLLAVSLFFPQKDLIEQSDIQKFVRQTISTVIWTLYFLKSKRVRATFVRQRQGKVRMTQPVEQNA